MNMQPLPVEDFSGGITDFVFDGNPNEAETLDNLLINRNRKPRTRGGSIVQGQQLPGGASAVQHISRLRTNIFYIQGTRIYWYDGTNYNLITNPNGGQLFYSTSGSPVVSDTEWRNHLLFATEDYTPIQKLFVDGTNTFRIRSAGLPSIPNTINITNPPGTGASYLYSFCFRESYTNVDLEFLNFGPEYVYPNAVVGGAITLTNTDTITLPTALADNGGYDVANLKIDIYRTTSNGSTFYLVATVPFGTATYTDNTTDADLISQPTIYTTASPSYDTPPLSKYVHAINDVAYYANIKTGTNIDQTLVLQSIPGITEAVPGSYYANTEQNIKGLSSIFNRPLVFCDEYIYRIDNQFDGTGNGGMVLVRINDTAGLANNESIVRTPIGIFWAGNNGFYWSDGFDVKLITPHLPKTYANIVLSTATQKNIKGTYDKALERVFWTYSKNESSSADSMFCLHLAYRGQDNRGCFTTMSGDIDFRPTSVLQYGDNLYRGDSRGYVFIHNEQYTTDKKVDVTKATNLWEDKTIFYLYKSCFIDFGSKFFRKFVPRILISASNTTNLSLAIGSSNDNDRVTGELKPIRYTANITWGDEFPLWGDATAVWDRQGVIEEWRRFPAGGLRCNYKQIILQNANTQIFNSDLLGAAVINGAAKTASIAAWPPGLVDYFISFEADGYQNQYQITQWTSTVLTFADPNNTCPQGNNSHKYIIYGYPKGQVLELNGYVIHWSFISKSHTPFSASSLGGEPT